MKDITKQYLKRLNIDAQQEPFTLLNEICQKHLMTFSFNNLDVLIKPDVILSLDIEDIAAKIITSGRGGYCFEHNKLLYDVLMDLGVSVKAQFARVVYGRTGEFARTHRVSLVELNEITYLMDGGFGPYTPSALVPLSGEEVICPNGRRYRVTQIAKDEHQLELFTDDAFFALYSFDFDTFNEADFKVANFYANCHPDSKFVKELVISKITDEEVIFITKNMFTRMTTQGRVDQEINDVAGLDRLLKNQFDISLDEGALSKVYNLKSI